MRQTGYSCSAAGGRHLIVKESETMARATGALLLLIVTVSSSQEQLGTFVSFQHGVEGSLEGDGNSLTIHDFSYDGRGPAGSTYFYVVNSSYVYSPKDFERGYSGSSGFKVTVNIYIRNPYPILGT